MMKIQKKDELLRANFAAFTNALCHCNATPLSVAVLVPCAWGENLACGGAWQRVLNSAELGVASLATKRQSVAQQIQCGANVAVFAGEADKAKMGQCLGGGLLSLSLSLLALFGTPLRSI